MTIFDVEQSSDCIEVLAYEYGFAVRWDPSTFSFALCELTTDGKGCWDMSEPVDTFTRHDNGSALSVERGIEAAEAILRDVIESVTTW